MSNRKNEKKSLDIEEKLDDMLVRWANEEIELPEGFHDDFMKKLRAEQIKEQPKKKQPVICYMMRYKRWLSVAAAAVILLGCMPILQHFAKNDFTQDNYVALPQQSDEQEEASEEKNAKENESAQALDTKKEDLSMKETTVEEKVDTAITQKQMVEEGQENTSKRIVEKSTQQPQSKAAQTKSTTENSTQQAETDDHETIGVPTTEYGLAATALQTMDGTEQKAVAGTQEMDSVNSIPEKDDTSYTEAIQQLAAELEEMQQSLKDCQEALEKDPQNEEQKKMKKELEEKIRLRKIEIQYLESLIQNTNT